VMRSSAFSHRVYRLFDPYSLTWKWLQPDSTRLLLTQRIDFLEWLTLYSMLEAGVVTMRSSISFGNIVNTITFEDTLKRCYHGSCDADSVCFDFSRVEWCDTPELSLLVLWISELLDLGKAVSFLLPSEEPLAHEGAISSEGVRKHVANRVEVYSHLVQCRFINFLVNRVIIQRRDTYGRKLTRKPKPIEAPLAPLVFFDTAKDLRDFIHLLGGREYEAQFAPATAVRAVETGEIRDVILSELGQNIFEHGEGRFGHLLMTVRNPAKSANPSRAVPRTMSSVPLFARMFFTNTSQSGYLVVILADKGPGIWETLQPAYVLDSIITNKKDRPTEADIVEYAFLRHSTRKTREERLGDLRRMLKEETELLPPTGLFSVLQVVRECNGLLVLRTGHSLVAYDFLTYPETGYPKIQALTNGLDQHLRELQDFSGTQVRIYLPMKVSARKRSVFLRTSAHAAIPNRSYHYLALVDTLGNLGQQDNVDYADWLLSIRDQVDKVHYYSSNNPAVVVIDCDQWPVSVEGRKALFLLLNELQQLQSLNLCVTLINVSGAVHNILSERAESSRTRSDTALSPLLAFDQDRNLSLFGLTEDETSKFLTWLRETPTTVSLESYGLPGNVASRLQHLIWHDETTGMYGLVVTWRSIVEVLKNTLGNRIASHILDQSNRIHHKQGCFLVPSGAYGEGFFELRRLFKNSDVRQKLTSLIRYYLELLHPETVVTLGKSLGEIAGEAIKTLNLEHINVLEPRKEMSSIKIALLPKGRKVVLITDVIGTQRTLNTVLSTCDKHEVLGILAIVDARESGDDQRIISGDRSYALESIVRSPIKFSYDDKPAHYRYEDIIRVDPVSDAPIDEPFLLNEPIWQQMKADTGENGFLEGILREANAVVIGHFENNRRHLLYLFLLPEVARAYGADIAENIRRDLKSYEERGALPPPITHVFYSQNTPGADAIAKALSAVLGASVTEGLHPDQVKFPLSFPAASTQLGAALIFDDASATGHTAFQMMEFVERNGFRRIFIYILTNRANRLQSRNLQKISKYGAAEVAVRYLSELPIPTFSETDCPECETIKHLQMIRNEAKSIPELVQVIDEQIRQRQPQRVAIVLEPETMLPFRSMPLDQRIEQAKLRSQIELAKTSLPLRKCLSEVVENKYYDMHPDSALSLLSVLYRERHLFFKDPSIKNDVLYDNFRTRISEACYYFLKRADQLSPWELHSVSGVFTEIDPEGFLNYFSNAIRKLGGKDTLWRIMVEMLQSEAIRERAYQVVHLMRQTETSLPSQVTILWENMIWKPEETNKLWGLYRKAIIQLRDSSPGPTYVDALSSCERENDPVILEYWTALFSVMKRDVLPVLEQLARSNVATDVCLRLQERYLEIVGLLNKCEELISVMLENKCTMEERDEARTGFFDGVKILWRLLTQGGPATAKYELVSLHTNLNMVVQSYFDKVRSDLDEQRITLEYECLDDSVFVFGNLPDVYLIVSNLMDNAIRHGFDRVESRTPKVISVRVDTDQSSDRVTLTVRDSGRGLPLDWQYGVGLNLVSTRCRRFCAAWSPPSLSQLPFATEVKVEFYKVMVDD
jgi:signal transduction histidine kinase/orotate phosphoribosyltransferase